MKKIVRILLFSFLLITIATYSYAGNITAGILKPEIDRNLAKIISGFVGVVQIVGTFVAVVASILLGIRYVLSSVDEKADIKKKLIPFVVGVIIFYGATGILQLIAGVAAWIK